MSQEQVSQANETVVVAFEVPNAKPLEVEFLKVSSIADVKLTLAAIPATEHYTSYALTNQGQTIADTTLLADLLSNVSQKKLALGIRPLAYTEKSIQDHLIKTRELLGFSSYSSESFGVSAGVSQLNSLNLEPIPQQIEEKNNSERESEDKPKEIKLPERSTEERAKVNDLISQFFNNLPQNYYVSTPLNTPAIRALYLSAWNPVSLACKSKGHLTYITAQTLEGETLHLTGSVGGFYVNKSSSTKFDPSPREGSIKYKTLFELLSKSSKNLSSQIKANNERLQKIEPATVIEPQTAFLSTPWITKALNPLPDFAKTQLESHANRDFNDEFQTIKELPSSSIPDRVLREKLLAKTSYEFTVEAAKGAVSILNGGITSMNPDEEFQHQIFLHNGIFYSFGVDVTGAFAERGGNAACRASGNQDLQAIKFLNTVGAKGIYTLMTTIVDFAGKRVICQTPVPGLFTSSEPKEVKHEETGEIELTDGDALTTVNYGQNETEENIETDAEFVTALEDVRKALHFKKKSLGDKGDIVTNPEIKGMRGTDRRKYILDLYNSTPLDIEFIEKHFNPSAEDSYPHKQTVVRLEAVQDWWTTKTKSLIAEEAKKQDIDLNATLKEGEEPPQVTIEEILFSVDAFQTEGAEDPNVRELSQYITNELIPRFIDQYNQQGTVTPIDGANLTAQMHKFGINIRYLGEVAKQMEKRISEALEKETKFLTQCTEHNKEFESKMEERNKFMQEEYVNKAKAEAEGKTYDLKEIPDIKFEDIEVEAISYSKQAQAIFGIIIQEMIARAAKHILRSYAIDLPVALVPSLVAHFHNALIGTSFNNEPVAVIEDDDAYTEVDIPFTKITPQSLREAIEKDVKICYRFDLPYDWVAALSPIQLQREIALKFGIQWNLREYFFDRETYDIHIAALQKDKKNKKNKNIVEYTNVFEPADASFVPLIKDTIQRASTAEQFFDAGRQSLASEDERNKAEGLQLISESLSIYEQIYGEVHTEVQRVYSSLSEIYQATGLKRQATYASRKAAALAERLYGLDAHDTIVALLNLAYLELDSGSLENSLKVYGRVTQIWKGVYENKSISIPTLLLSVGTTLQEQGYYREAIQLCNQLVELSCKIHGEKSYATGLIKFRVSFLYALSERYTECLKEATAAYEILAEVASEKCHMTAQARDLKTRIQQWKQIQDAQAKAQKLTESKNGKKTESVSKKSKKSVLSMDSNSIDDVYSYIVGDAGTGKKNKKSKGKN